MWPRGLSLSMTCIKAWLTLLMPTSRRVQTKVLYSIASEHGTALLSVSVLPAPHALSNYGETTGNQYDLLATTLSSCLLSSSGPRANNMDVHACVYVYDSRRTQPCIGARVGDNCQ